MHHGHYGDDRRYSDNIINDRKVTFGVGVHVLDCLDDEYNFQSLLLAKFCYASFFLSRENHPFHLHSTSSLGGGGLRRNISINLKWCVYSGATERTNVADTAGRLMRNIARQHPQPSCVELKFPLKQRNVATT